MYQRSQGAMPGKYARTSSNHQNWLKVCSINACRSLACIYFTETDTLTIYLVEPTPGLIIESDELVPGLLADYACGNKLVAMDISMARQRIPASADIWQDYQHQLLQEVCT